MPSDIKLSMYYIVHIQCIFRTRLRHNGTITSEKETPKPVYRLCNDARSGRPHRGTTEPNPIHTDPLP